MKKEIFDQSFGGERPLFADHDLLIDRVTIEPGESALKCCHDVEARNCVFRGKYPFWHTDRFSIDHCVFEPGARAAIWYSNDCVMRHCDIQAPKMFREMHGLHVEDTVFHDAQETMWHCSDVVLDKVQMHNADYLFMHGADIRIADYLQHGNYSFQYCSDVVIRNAEIHSKDAFWNTHGVTVYDSELDGEYLGWHSHGLRLVNCHISGTQPLCYCHGLVLENCTFGPDADLAFEDSDLRATVKGGIVSIKNPKSGHIVIDSVGEIIRDEHIKAPADCVIEVGGVRK